jgi:hypothetical protein
VFGDIARTGAGGVPYGENEQNHRFQCFNRDLKLQRNAIWTEFLEESFIKLQIRAVSYVHVGQKYCHLEESFFGNNASVNKTEIHVNGGKNQCQITGKYRIFR